MDKQDYIEELNRIDEIDIKNQLVRDLLVREFKLECTHNESDITVDSSYEEDEYGKHMESWTKHYYTCNNCNCTTGGFKTKLKSITEIQSAITDAVERAYRL